MSENTEKFKLIFTALDYFENPGFISAAQAKSNNHRSFIFNQLKKLLDIDAAYFVADTPIIFFKEFSESSEQQISDLHRKVWNQGIAPILFVLLPDQLRIYSAFKAPVQKNGRASAEKALIHSIDITNNLNPDDKRLKDFERIQIDTGNIWRAYSNEFDVNDRINQHLLHSLKDLRKELKSAGLKYEFCHSLIGRTVIIRYLEDRGFISPEFYNKIDGKINNFADLLTSKMKAYDLFAKLNQFYGNDIFPVSPEEKKAVSNAHLLKLKEILNSHKSHSGLSFNVYSFDLIPVELICSIYEEFLYIEDKDKDIASYTPPSLAKIMLDQILPYSGPAITDIKILDPACGSSIFLVEAFKRLAERFILQNNIKYPAKEALDKILQDSIFGFDLNIEALRFTTFNLLLALLDYLDNINIDAPLNFPQLIGKNLVESDFFEEKSKLHKAKYDIIVGNPPWQSNYGDKPKEYLKKSKHPVGDKQISQVFLWHAGDLIKDNGSICMLMPSKGLLYNFNPKNMEFRDKFFKSFNIKKIINLSLFSNLLFENSKFPATIIVYSPEKADKPSKSTVYYAPKPSNKFWEFSTLIVDSSDVKSLPRQQILKNQAIWKIAYVGTGRDFILINHLDKSFPKIDYICEDRKWKYGEGFQLGGGDKNINNEMADMLYIPAKSILPFFVNKKEVEKLGTNTFHRPRDFDLYKAPHTIVRGGQIYAAYIDYDAVFTHAVMSFAATNPDDANLLKLLAAYLNSSMALYYLFLTSSTWCIERTDIHLAEYRTLPFAIPSSEKLLNKVIKTYDELSDIVAKDVKDFLTSQAYLDKRKELDNYIFDIFDLNNEQRMLILDINDYGITYFQDYSKSSRAKNFLVSTNKPDVELLKDYAKLFCNVLNKDLYKHKYHISSTVYSGKAPLDVIAFTMAPGSKHSDEVKVVSTPEEQTKLLRKLDKMVFKQTKESLYIAKNLRVFEGNTFYIAKPSEIRFWNSSMALNDADKNLKEILKGFKEK